MAPHSNTLSWKIPSIEEPGRLQSMGSLGVDTTELLHFHFSLSCIGEGNGNPLPCSCLENPRDGEAWWAAVYGVAQSDTTDATKQQQQQYIYQRMEPISKTLFGIYIAEVFMQFQEDYIYDVHWNIFSHHPRKTLGPLPHTPLPRCNPCSQFYQ